MITWQEKLLNLDPIDLFEYKDQIPEFKPLLECVQDKGWHAEGNVLIHMNMVLKEALKVIQVNSIEIEDAQTLYISSLLHDIGKPETTFVNKKTGKTVAYGHEHVGVKYAREFLRKYFPEMPVKQVFDILSLVEFHGHPKRLIKGGSKDRRFRQLSCEVNTELVYFLEIADFKGREGSSCEEALQSLEDFKEKCIKLEIWGKPFSEFDKLEQQRGLFGGLRRDLAGRKTDDHEFIFSIGAPASGKTTFLKKNYVNYEFISMDDERFRLCGTMADMSRNQEVYENCFKILAEKLNRKKSCIWDATSLTRKARRRLVQLARNTGAKVTAVYFDISFKELLNRNLSRERHVPEDVILRFHESIQTPKIYEYDQLRVVSEEKELSGRS